MTYCQYSLKKGKSLLASKSTFYFIIKNSQLHCTLPGEFAIREGVSSREDMSPGVYFLDVGIMLNIE